MPSLLDGLRRSAIAVILSSGMFSVYLGASEPAIRCESQPYVVKIHADWCGSCQAIQPTWEELRSAVGNGATFLTLDVTDRSAAETSRSIAEELGLTEFFLDYRRQTGTVGVIGCQTLETVAILRAEHNLAKYREAIAMAAPAP